MVSENVSGGMDDEVVLITGGTSGIGKAAATALAATGAEVVVTGRNEERGEGSGRGDPAPVRQREGLPYARQPRGAGGGS